MRGYGINRPVARMFHTLHTPPAGASTGDGRRKYRLQEGEAWAERGQELILPTRMAQGQFRNTAFASGAKRVVLGFTLRGSRYLQKKLYGARANGASQVRHIKLMEGTPMSKGSGSGDDADLPQAASGLLENAAKEQIPGRIVELAEQLEQALSVARKEPEKG